MSALPLSELIDGLGLPEMDLPSDPQISGVSHDSRAVSPGDLFVAWSGGRFDGRAFVPQAVERGAVAVLAPGGRPAGLAAEIPWLSAANPRALLGPLAARAYGHPDRELILAGVTGTNGKSTVASLLAAIFEQTGRPAGFIGTLGYRLRGKSFPGERTTPEASDLFRTLRAMREAGASAVAMEVSSHALEQGRADGAAFDLALFTNLSRDHLDLHGDMESYFAAKRRLFDRLKPGGRAVINVDDEYGRRLAADLPDAWTYSVEGGEATVTVRDAKLDRHGLAATIAVAIGKSGLKDEFEIASPLLGRYNLSNLVGAIAGALALSTVATVAAVAIPRSAIVAAAAAQRPVPGRMEPVECGQPFAAIVDYAHTDAALSAAISSVREIVPGRTIVVFGCGGDRDPGKRPVMGRVAGELADLAIATSDNPRSEDPHAILAAVEEGLRSTGKTNYLLIPDRRDAIRTAIAAAEEGSAVLIAGKGHERDQTIGDRRLPFSDYEEIERALTERFGVRLGL
ncbi:MAG TPA: UDP-N-acetylmuramoyl-L-alanyl-D-glutamate--2,6-diaminopimelate ligase [Thermoanaerobaculia bacterium]|jgi:UDP-N-acetylmuramoyl-L-alanyl-D-glutamate--2,6-diaminopimelate ligase|nr:UDP-N-acetylmuramoyl-L-alanyl-D-glutamate--2,6-diaminopimelate ligase [Thermoanaerobaculia bacterium]